MSSSSLHYSYYALCLLCTATVQHCWNVKLEFKVKSYIMSMLASLSWMCLIPNTALLVAQLTLPYKVTVLQPNVVGFQAQSWTKSQWMSSVSTNKGTTNYCYPALSLVTLYTFKLLLYTTSFQNFFNLAGFLVRNR